MRFFDEKEKQILSAGDNRSRYRKITIELKENERLVAARSKNINHAYGTTITDFEFIKMAE